MTRIWRIFLKSLQLFDVGGQKEAAQSEIFSGTSLGRRLPSWPLECACQNKVSRVWMCGWIWVLMRQSEKCVQVIYAVNFTSFFIHLLFFIIEAILVSTAWPKRQNIVILEQIFFSCFCLSFHNCTFDWDDKIVHFCCAQLKGLYARLRCLSHAVKLFDPVWMKTEVIYLVCCSGKIHWLWRQQLSGTNQPWEGDTGPFPPVMDVHICIFAAGEYVIENPTVP